MIDYKLTPDENTEEALTANDAGTLTIKQQQRLLTAINQSARPFWSFFPIPQVILNDIKMFLLLLPFTFLLLQSISSLLAGGFLLLIALVLVAYALRYQRYHARLDILRRRLQSAAYAIESYVGPANFVIEPQAVSEQFVTTYVDSYQIRTPDYQFTVSKALWEKLRPDAEDITLYYLTEPFVMLLSAEPVPVPEPPTDNELANVIGLGADGELIYKEEDTPRRLVNQRKSDG